MDTDFKSSNSSNYSIKTLGCVLIGRNEGNRLHAAIDSIPCEILTQSVYVDSGSTDGSQEYAVKKGIHVIQLDDTLPFTAARARNAGARELIKLHPTIIYIQFFDGDCSLEKGWLETAINFLENNSDVAIVCGQRKERYPHKSIYNWLCDIEWDTPIGEAEACGGDFCARINAFKEVSGFNPNLIAGEEPDLCYRIRRSGMSIYRLDKIMTWHDANITNFSQWFIRNVRAGYAYTELFFTYRKEKSAFRRREFIRIISWAFVLPITTIIITIFETKFIFTLLLYPYQIYRIRSRQNGQKRSYTYATFMVLSKFPEFFGTLKYFYQKLLNKKQEIIEYK